MPPGSIVLSTRAPIGSVSETTTEMAFNQGCRGLIPRQGLDSRFFRYQLSVMGEQLQALGQGSTFMELGTDDLASTSIVVPTAEEQRVIADYLDRETARIDTVIAMRHQLVDLLTERHRSLMTDVIIGNRGPGVVKESSRQNGPPTSSLGSAERKDWHLSISSCPSAWHRTQLRAVLTRRKKTGQPGLPLLSVNLPAGVVVRPLRDDLPAPSSDLSGYQEVRPGDLVMNQLGKPHGALGVSQHHGIISPAYFVAELSPLVHPRFVHHLLRTRLYISEYERRGKFQPPSQFDLSWDQFRTIPVALPDRETQKAIADYLDAESVEIYALIAKSQKSIHLLGERRQALITAAVTGELEIAS